MEAARAAVEYGYYGADGLSSNTLSASCKVTVGFSFKQCHVGPKSDVDACQWGRRKSAASDLRLRGRLINIRLRYLRIDAFADSPMQAQNINVLTYERESIFDNASAHTGSMLLTGRMISTLFLSWWVLSLFTISSSALPPPSSSISTSSKKLGVIDTASTNITGLQELSSPTLSYTPDCNYIYGQNLNPRSCYNALAKITRSMTPLAFGQRKTGPWDVILPRRYLSGMYSWNT